MFIRRTTTTIPAGAGAGAGVYAYQGGLKNGFRHGWGKMQYADGHAYEGSWMNDRMHGRGTYYFADGNKFEGDFENGVSTMMHRGQGKLTYATGDIYDGEFESGERNGLGSLSYANGNVYRGQWKDGKHHGTGTATYPTLHQFGQDVYEGEWVDGEHHGWGIYTYANGDVFTGDFQNGTQHGKGTFEYANKNVYCGEFKHGKAHGHGTMKYAGGESYEGDFEGDQRHGNGTMKYEDGREYSGEWKYGNAYGIGTFKWPHGDEYEGGFKEGTFHGRGIMKHAKGGASDYIYDNGVFLSKEKHTAAFFTKLLALNDTGLEIYESILELTPLVEDVHMMKFLYTLVASCRRMDFLKEEEVMNIIEKGLENASETITHEAALVIFKLILEKADNDGFITRANYYKFDNRGELKRIENAPFIKCIMEAIQLNHLHIQGLEANVKIINDSLNAVRAGLKRKLKVEAAVGFISCVLNAISFGVGGSLVSAAQQAAINSIVDFGDPAHVISIVENTSGPNSDICKEILYKGMDTVADMIANKKLEGAIKDQGNGLAVVVAASHFMVYYDDMAAGESKNNVCPGVPGGKEAKAGDDALQKCHFSEAITLYTKAITIDGNNYNYISRRSLAYLKNGNKSSALADANWAISLNPSGSTSYYAKGMVLQALNQYDEAIAAFEKGLEQCPNDDMLLQGLENVKMEKRYASDSCDRNEGDLFAFAQNPGHSYPQASAPPMETPLRSEVQHNKFQPQDGLRDENSNAAESNNEVSQWLRTSMPRLQQHDLANYCKSLVMDGFDSVAVILELLEENDLHFMKKAHRRALVNKLKETKER